MSRRVQCPASARNFMKMRVLRLLILSVFCLFCIFFPGRDSLALQKHTLESAAPSVSQGAANQPTAPATSTQSPPSSPAPETAHGPSQPGGSPAVEPKPSIGAPSQAALPKTSGAQEAPFPLKGEPYPATLPSHAEEEKHKEHGVVLPQISPTPGVTFVETMIALMEYELKGRFLGWRPNDLIVGRFTDNINNYQLGVLEAMRFTTLRLKDSLTRMGEADTYDRDLEDALNLFMNKATLFWFPSAETSYGEAVEHLKKFLEKLKTGRRNFYYRVDNLLSLLKSYGDLLGNVNKSLIIDRYPDGRPVSWFAVDDYFYYAKGVAHVMYEILRVVRVGFYEQLVTLDAVDIMDEILHELYRAEQMDPWLVLDGDLDGFLANHRANLNAPLSEVAHLITIVSRF